MAVSLMQYTLRYLREQGYMVEKVEHWNGHAKIRQDLFGIIDILAIRGGQTLGVQVTDRSNVSKRVKKIEDSPKTPTLLKAGWDIVVFGWYKRDGKWTFSETPIT